MATSKEVQKPRSDEPGKFPKKESVIHKAGDMLERVGEKIKNAGADTVGNAIYKAGNKLEHMNDKKKKS